jgi:hypothetical protein
VHSEGYGMQPSINTDELHDGEEKVLGLLSGNHGGWH